jgi:lysozyme family protein
MPVSFEVAFNYVLDSEDSTRSGVVTPEPNGGRARLGINSVYHPEMPTEFWTCLVAQALPMAEVTYNQWYWSVLKLDAAADQQVANKILDSGFWMGVGRAGRWAQSAVNALTNADTLEVDGILGSLSWHAINAASSLSLRQALASLVEAQVERDVAAHPAEANERASLLARAQKLG